MGMGYIKIKYDTPIEVSKKQYDIIINDFSGVVAHRTENGKYFVKVLLMKYSKFIKQIINKI
jgi:hypothetical protein